MQLKAQWWSRKPIKHPSVTMTSALEKRVITLCSTDKKPSSFWMSLELFCAKNSSRVPSPPPFHFNPSVSPSPRMGSALREQQGSTSFCMAVYSGRTLSIPWDRKWLFSQRLCRVNLFLLLGATWKHLRVSVLLRLKWWWWWWFLFPEVRAICNSIILWGWSGHFTALIWWDLYLCWGGCRASKESSSACAALPYAQQYFHILSPSFPSSSFYLVLVFISKCLIVFLVTDFLQIAIW